MEITSRLRLLTATSDAARAAARAGEAGVQPRRGLRPARRARRDGWRPLSRIAGTGGRSRGIRWLGSP